MKYTYNGILYRGKNKLKVKCNIMHESYKHVEKKTRHHRVHIKILFIQSLTIEKLICEDWGCT